MMSGLSVSDCGSSFCDVSWLIGLSSLSPWYYDFTHLFTFILILRLHLFSEIGIIDNIQLEMSMFARVV